MKFYETTLDPITKATVKIKLYRNVKNVPELRKKIVSGQLKICVVKPTLIVDPFQVAVAANKAAVAEIQNRLITRTVFSEILFNLSVSKNVSASLLQFGIDDKYTDILVVTICKEESNEDLFKGVDGEERDLDELGSITDVKAVKKIYKINAEEEKNSSLLNSVVNKIVIKDF